MDPGEPEARDALLGSTLIDKYKIIRQLGRGGMGVVYEAEHVGLGKRVAVKLMLEKYADDKDAISRFKREALAASRIGNPHIIDISDIGVAADGRSFVVMELLTGSSLADVIRAGGAMAPARAVEIIRQTLRAAGAAHAKGIVHRDLKPDNIFLIDQDDGRDFVKLLDFGISKVLDQAAEIARTKLTSTGTVIGTPLYMAPEQAMGEATDQRADIYALGVILYELLAGTPPFAGVTYPVLLVKLLTVPPELLSEVCPGVPAPLVAAVHRALEKDPASRFPTCEAFVAALGGDGRVSAQRQAPTADAFALDQTVTSSDVAVATVPNVRAPVAPVATLPPAARRSPLPMILAAFGGAVVVGAILVVMKLADQSPAAAPAPAPAVAQAASPPVSTAAAPAATPAPAPAAAAPVAPIVPTPTPTPTPAPAPAPAKLVPAAPPPPPPAHRPARATTTDDVQAAIKRHDGKGCRAALAALASPPPTDYRVASLHAVCEMVAGNCDGGTAEQAALYQREGTPPTSAKFIAEIYCPVGNDPVIRLQRLGKQLAMFSDFDCDYYIGPARAAAAAAQTDADRRAVGSILGTIATCYSRRNKCDVARSVLAEAQVFIPALALNELSASCR